MSAGGVDRRQRFAARVRHTPGYLAVKEGVLPRLRGNAALTDLVWRVFTPDHELGAARRPLRPGGLAGRDVDRLPILAFTVLGLDDDGVARAIDEVLALQQSTRAFRPVLVLDRPAFAAGRSHDVVVDHIQSLDDWYGDPDEHATYVGRRLVSVVQGFRAWHLVHVTAAGVPAPDRAIVDGLALALHGRAGLDVRVVDREPTP